MNNKLRPVRQLCNDKCDTKDTLCDNRDDTYATMLNTLEMSVIHVYMVSKTH